MVDCELCGGKPLIDPNADGQYFVRCDFCGVETIPCITEYDAAKSWDAYHEAVLDSMDVMVEMLKQADEKTVESFMLQADYRMFLKFVDFNAESGIEWQVFTQHIAMQLKIIKLSSERIKKRVTDERNLLSKG